MTTVVLDASVIVKWIFPHRPGESQSDLAVTILQSVRAGRLEVIQPPHWLAEVAAVTARLQPTLAEEAVSLLYALEFPVVGEIEVYQRACDLAISLRQHVFDTLYHAVALSQSGAVLITADEQYYRKGSSFGGITRLKDFQPS
ncbi:MAG: type II toxin-antitoxin system VapC family toxin [Nitrospiraceae bacterium]